jgi:hypothetical protein
MLFAVGQLFSFIPDKVEVLLSSILVSPELSGFQILKIYLLPSVILQKLACAFTLPKIYMIFTENDDFRRQSICSQLYLFPLIRTNAV